MGYHKCEEEGCRRKGQTATNGCSLFCIAHMRQRGLEPKQKQCQEPGCAKQVATSTDGSRMYCWAHMKHHGLQPRQHKCTVKDCTKRVQTSSDGQRIYCISHMKTFNMKPRQPYCQQPGCKKRAHYSAAGQRTHCIAHMREKGLCPHPRAGSGAGAAGNDKSDHGGEDSMAVDEGDETAPETDNVVSQQWSAPRQEASMAVPTPSEPPHNQPARQSSWTPSPPTPRSPAHTSLDELEDIELLKLAEVLLESGISFREVLSLVTALQEHEKSSTLLGSTAATSHAELSQPDGLLSALGLEELLSRRSSARQPSSTQNERSESFQSVSELMARSLQEIHQRLGPAATQQVAGSGTREAQRQLQGSGAAALFGLASSGGDHAMQPVGTHPPTDRYPSRGTSPVGPSASTISSSHPDCSTPVLHRSRTLSHTNRLMPAPGTADPAHIDDSPSSSSLSSPNPTLQWNSHIPVASAKTLSCTAAYGADSIAGSASLHRSMTPSEQVNISILHASSALLKALDDTAAHNMQPGSNHAIPPPRTAHPSAPGLPHISMNASLSPTLKPNVLTSILAPQLHLSSTTTARDQSSPSPQLPVHVSELSVLDELSDEELLAVVRAAQSRLVRGTQTNTSPSSPDERLLRESERLALLRDSEVIVGGGLGPQAADVGICLQQHAQRAEREWALGSGLQVGMVGNGGSIATSEAFGRGVSNLRQGSLMGSRVLGGAGGIHEDGHLTRAGMGGRGVAVSDQGRMYGLGLSLRDAEEEDATPRLDSHLLSQILGGQTSVLHTRHSATGGISDELLNVLNATEVHGLSRDQILAELMMSLVEEEEAALSSMGQESSLDSLRQGQQLQLLTALRAQEGRSLSTSSLA